jgi:Fe-S oxidoreductase
MYFRVVTISIEVGILAAAFYSLLSGVVQTVFDIGLQQKYYRFITLVLILMGCLISAFLVGHLVMFYPSLTSISRQGAKLDSSNLYFWMTQAFYIRKVFLPVIIGFGVVFVALLAFFAFNFWWRHYRLWHLGKDEHCCDQVSERLKSLFAVVFAHARFWEEPFPGIMHFLIFGGIFLVFLGKGIRLFSLLTGLTTPPQLIYLSASFISEMGGITVFLGGGIAIVRRFLIKPSRLDSKLDDHRIYVWGFVILITGYLVKSYRIAAAGGSLPPDSFFWAPVSSILSRLTLISTPELNELLVWHRALIHAIPATMLISYIILSRSSLQHIYLSPLNIFLRSLKPKGAINPIVNFEEEKTYGVSEVKEFTWKQLLDLEACTRCGRCQDNCPAHLSEKPLSPKKFIQDLKTHLYETYPLPLVIKPVETRRDMIAESVTEEVVWDCTTCRACEDICPIYVEHVDKIIDMRRSLVMEQGSLSRVAKEALRSIEDRGHPWKGSEYIRTDWTNGLRVKVLSENSRADLLFWVGCAGAFYDRNRNITIGMARILELAGVDFAILGLEETCCGDPARRIGDEYLFQTIAKQNIETLRRYGIENIVTTCPHCFNTIRNEYPQFGGNFHVRHYTELIADLVSQSKLKFSRSIKKTLAYQDPCYLGRYNRIYEAPRQALRAIPGVSVKEINRSRHMSMCCGGGGGHIWMEEIRGKRINQLRTEHFVSAAIDIIVTTCPYCLQMLEDGVTAKQVQRSTAVMDLIELVQDAIRAPV